MARRLNLDWDTAIGNLIRDAVAAGHFPDGTSIWVRRRGSRVPRLSHAEKKALRKVERRAHRSPPGLPRRCRRERRFNQIALAQCAANSPDDAAFPAWQLRWFVPPPCTFLSNLQSVHRYLREAGSGM